MAAENSIRKMQEMKVITRKDGNRIELCNIHFKPDFNPPGRNDEDEEEDRQLYEHIKEYGWSRLPAILVSVRAEGGVWVLDGHRRITQTRKAVAAGVDLSDRRSGKILIDIRQVENANDEDEHYIIAESNRNKVMKPEQMAWWIKRAKNFGRSNEFIADKLKTSPATIAFYLDFGKAPAAVQSMVSSGVVSLTEAVKVVREHGDKATEILTASEKVAKESGKTKVTAKSINKVAPKKAPTGVTKRDIQAAEIALNHVLEVVRDTISGDMYDSLIDLDVAPILAEKLK